MKKETIEIMNTNLFYVFPTQRAKPLILMLLGFLIVAFSKLVAQDLPRLEWVSQMGGTGFNTGEDIFVDGTGNVYTTGLFWGTVDFDPGVGTFDLTSAGTSDIFVTKHDALGSLIWAVRMGGTGNDDGFSITVDGNGNVLTTGHFRNTVDFDPGPGVFNLSAGFYDSFISKLDASGNFVWAVKFGEGSNDQNGYSIAVDAIGNVYTTGSYINTVDFDPGVGVFNLSSACTDAYVSKLSPTGDFIWAKRLGGTDCQEEGNSILVNATGDVYITGRFGGTADFDPNAGTFNLTSAGSYDIFICKLDASGSLLWAKQLGGASSDETTGMVMDGSGNLLITGQFSGTADFDPGGGVFTLSSLGSNDVFVCKLSNSGDFIWAKGMGGTSGDFGHDITVDPLGNVYTTGEFRGLVDFDPGPMTFNLDGGTVDGFVSKLDASGNLSWAIEIGGSGFDYGYGITVDALENVYTTGSFYSANTDFDPTTCPFLLATLGSGDIFIQKLSKAIPIPPLHTITDFTPSVGPIGTSVTITGTNFSTTPANNVVKFFNNIIATVTASTATSLTVTVPVGTTTGKISVTTNCLTSISATDFTVGVALPPTITSFTPTSGAVGTTVTIIGTNFSSTLANNIVYFGATKTIVTAATSTQLTVTVPIGATYHPISVLVGNLIAYSKEPFVVTFGGGPGIDANSFAPPVNFAAATQPQSLVTGDFDGDGKVDMAVPNIFDNSISVFRNSSSGSGNINYAAKIDFAAGNRPESMTVADLDGDGKLDLAVTNENANTVSIFRNTSSGVGIISFAAKIDFPTATRPVSISISDFDKDGKSDVAVVNRNSSSISIFRNTSTGAGNIAFAAKMDFTTGSGAEFVFVADFDGDTKTDLAVANEGDFSVSIFRNTSTGIGNINFATKIDFASGPNPIWVSAGDLDGDGKAELFASNADDASVSMYLNTSTGPGNISFDTQTFLDLESAAVSLMLGDIDGDGKVDLAVANDGLANSAGQSFTLFRSTGTPGNLSFAPKVIFPIGFSCDFAALGDFDGDGKTDIAATSSNDEILVYRNALISSPTPSSSNWVRKIGSMGGQRGESIAIDDSGNSYTCGNFGNTVDFDPGSGVFNITAQSLDAFVVKLDENGDFVWAKSMGGTGSDNALSIKLDAIGNIYVAGTFSGTADFDPGAGTFNLTAVGSTDLFITKLNNNGDFVWAKSISGSSFKELTAIALDATGNVYATGYFASTADFDPSASVVNLTSNGSFDAFLLKLDDNGNFVWVRQIGSTGLDVIEDVTVSLSGNPHITGYFEDTVDFDPGPGTSSFTSLGETDIFITKFDASGNFLWTNHIGSSSFDYGYSLITDATDNVYATGSFSLTADFDPGAGVNNLTAPDGSGFVVKFASNGSFVWANHFEGPFGSTNAYSIGLDDSNNSYVTGDTFDGSDAGQIILTGFDSNGIKTFQDIADGSGSGSSIAVSSSSNIYVTGFFASNVNFTLGDCLGTLTNVSDDAFILKTRANSFAFPTITSFTPTSGSAGTVITITGINFNIIPSNNIVDFDGVLAIVTASTATTITTLAPVGVGTGKISVTTCGTATSTADFIVTTNPNNQPPVIAASTSAVPINGIITIDLLPLISDPDDNVDLSTLSLSSNISEQGASASITQSFELVLDYGGVAFAGTDHVLLSVCDLLGACDDQELSIEVSSDVIVYNAVSPNNDGLNDIFYIQYINLLPETQENKVNIFNRWGSKVFEVVDYNNDTNVFKGLNQNGVELPSGTYYYKIEFGNGQAAKTGYLVLKR